MRRLKVSNLAMQTGHIPPISGRRRPHCSQCVRSSQLVGQVEVLALFELFDALGYLGEFGRQ